MDFRDDAELDPSQVEDARAAGPQPRGGGLGGMPGCSSLPIGGKGGGCLLVLLAIGAIFLFANPMRNITGSGGPAPPGQPQEQPSGNLAARCRVGADADQSDDCRVVGIVNS